MNQKQSIKQLENVITLLENEKKAWLRQIKSLDHMIDTKLNFIAKIEKYRRDYDHANGERLSHTIPSLMINFSNFVKKMDASIQTEKNAIEKIQQDKRVIESKVIEVEKKIRAVKVLREGKLSALKIKDENRSLEADETLASLREFRSANE